MTTTTATPNIFRAMRESNCSLLTDDHRYGSGIGVALVPLAQAHIFDDLMSASGSIPFVFSYHCAPVTELPFVFAPTFDEAVIKLEERLASGVAHDPGLYLGPLMEAVDWDACKGGYGNWPRKYRNLYAEVLREIGRAKARVADAAERPPESAVFTLPVDQSFRQWMGVYLSSPGK